MKIINMRRAGAFAWLACCALGVTFAQDAPIRPAVQPSIIYPEESRRLAEEGTVVLQFVVDKAGQISSVDVLKSSGFERLDLAAVEAIKKSRFTPYMQNGVPVTATARRAIRFQLTPAIAADEKQPAGTAGGRLIPYAGFALEFETRVAFTKTAISKFSVTQASEPTLTSACLKGMKQWAAMNPSLQPQLMQRLAELRASTQRELQQLVQSVDEKALSTEEKLAFTDACLASMVRSLDQNSYFFSKKDLELVAKYNRDHWGEVWLQTEYEDGFATIKYIPPYANGYRAGLRVGDRIERIDDQRLGLGDRVQFRRLIRGPVGSHATLSVLRGNLSSTFTIDVERELPVRIGIRSERIGEDFLYLGAPRTDEASLTEISAALRKENNETTPVRGVILDLRNNPGDTVPSVVGVAATFVRPSTFLGEVRHAEKESSVQLYATPYFYRQSNLPDPLQRLPVWTKDVPLVVLVNNATGNGAEFIAAALQDSHRAIVIGQRTAARAMVRSQINDPNGAMLVLTSGYMYRQGNRRIDGVGVEPDIQATAESEQESQANLDGDPVVTAAVEVLLQRGKNSF